MAGQIWRARKCGPRILLAQVEFPAEVLQHLGSLLERAASRRSSPLADRSDPRNPADGLPGHHRPPRGAAEFLDVLLGDRPALTPTELVYQRLLVGDPIEATEQAAKFLKEKPLIDYYEEVLLGGLRLAQSDAERGLLDQERLQRIRDTVAEIVDDLSVHRDEAEPAAEAEAKTPLSHISKLEAAEPAVVEAADVPDRWRADGAVLCIPGVGLLDEAVTIALAELLRRQGIGARAEPADALSMSKLFALDTKDAMLICSAIWSRRHPPRCVTRRDASGARPRARLSWSASCKRTTQDWAKRRPTGRPPRTSLW